MTSGFSGFDTCAPRAQAPCIFPNPLYMTNGNPRSSIRLGRITVGQDVVENSRRQALIFNENQGLLKLGRDCRCGTGTLKGFHQVHRDYRFILNDEDGFMRSSGNCIHRTPRQRPKSFGGVCGEYS